MGGETDAKTNAAIEAAWNDWASGPVTVDGKLTLRRFEKLILKTMACDGEVFVRLWRGYEGNPHGLALQAIDADLIDETFNRPRRGTENEVRMLQEPPARRCPADHLRAKRGVSLGGNMGDDTRISQ